MNIKMDNFNKYEYTVTVENVIVNLIVNKLYGCNNNENISIEHTHLYTEIFVCLSGKISIQSNSGVIFLSKGDAAIVPTNMPHYKIRTDNSEDWCSVGFSATKKVGHSHFNLYKKLSPLFENTEVIVFRNVPDICQRIAEVQNSIYEADECLPALELVCILEKLAIKNPKINRNVNKLQKRMPDIYRIALLEDLIANHSSEPLTTGKVADMLHISSRHLSRVVKARYGITFHKVLVEMRLDKAKQLLIKTSRPVNTIAKEVGYSKSSAFYKDFSIKFGMTPTEYRNNFTS